MHSIRVDRIHRLVEVRLTGALDVVAADAAGADARAAVRGLGQAPEAHVSLYDLSAADTPAAGAIESAFRQWNDPRFSCVRARKVALVAPSALARLGLGGPSAARPNMQVFADRGAAMRWLFA